MAGESDNDRMARWNEEFIENPARAMHHWTQENNKTLRAEYDRKQKQDSFWNKLYGQHPHLKEEDHLVRTVMQREWDVLMGMSSEDAITELAHHSNLEIEKQSKRRAYQSEYTVFGGSPDGSSGMPAFADPDEHSLGGAIKARKQRRRDAQQGFTYSKGRAVAD